MKTALMTALLFSLVVNSGADVLTMLAVKQDGNIILTLQGRRVSHRELQQQLHRIATIDSRIAVYLKTLSNISLAETLEILKTIKASGLLNVVVMSEGTFDGEAGSFVFPIEMKTNAVSFCTSVETNDFLSKRFWDTSELLEIEQGKAEPTNAPYSSPAPRVQKR